MPQHHIHQRRGYLYGSATTRRAGGMEHADRFGTDLAMRPATPPPVAEYDKWLASRNERGHGQLHKAKKTGARLRRIVVMRRAGETWAACGEAVGVSRSVARAWVEMLPYELNV